MPHRHPDWPQRLEHTIERARHRPFMWGQHDCAHFALACLQAVRVQDWTALSLPHYRTARGARRALHQLGCANLPALATLILGAPHPPAQLRRGDLAALPTPQGVALGVCLGRLIAAPAAQGLSFFPLNQAQACWRV